MCSIYLLVIKVSSGVEVLRNLRLNMSFALEFVYRCLPCGTCLDHADVAHGSVLFHGKYNYATEVAKSAVYSVQTVLADGFFVSSILSHYFLWDILILVVWKVWRCYIVWNKNWFIIGLPIIMILGEMGW